MQKGTLFVLPLKWESVTSRALVLEERLINEMSESMMVSDWALFLTVNSPTRKKQWKAIRNIEPYKLLS